MSTDFRQSFRKLLEYGRLVGGVQSPSVDTGDDDTARQNQTAEIKHLQMNQKVKSKPCARFVELLNLCSLTSKTKQEVAGESETQPSQRLMVDLDPPKAPDLKTQLKQKRARVTATRLAALSSYLDKESQIE